MSSAMSSDDVVRSAIGDVGRWQIIICLCLSLTRIPGAWQQLSIIFLAPRVQYRCNAAVLGEDLGPLNGTGVQWIQPTDDPCFVESVNQSFGEFEDLDNTTRKCETWEYDRSIFPETIVTQWDLVCGRSQYPNIAQSTMMVGGLVGDILFGAISDRYGRKWPLIAAIALQVTGGIAAALAPWFSLLLALRIVTSLATSGTMLASNALCMEIVGGKWRKVVAILYSIPYSIGYILLPLVAYLTLHWRLFQIVISIPGVLLIPAYCWVVPESPKWLIAIGRYEQAASVLRRGAECNKRAPVIDADLVQQLSGKGTNNDTNNISENKRANLTDLFRTPNLRTKTLCLCVNWFVSGFCFFGLAQFIGQVGGNVFVNTAVAGALQVPGKLMCLFSLDRYGRRNTMLVALLVTTASSLLIMAVPRDGPTWPTVALALLASAGISVSTPTVFLFSAELFPTVVRNSGIGAASTCSRIGSILAPFAASLDSVSVYLPAACFGIVPLVGAALCLLLPETADTELPHSLEDGERFGKKGG